MLPHQIRITFMVYFDLMFIEGILFLITVIALLGLTMVTRLIFNQGARSAHTILKIVSYQIVSYTSNRFQIEIIFSDGEGITHAISPEFNEAKITLNPG